MGVEEGRVLRADHDVAVGDEVKPAGGRHAVHRGDDRLPAAVLDSRELERREAPLGVVIADLRVALGDVRHVVAGTQGFSTYAIAQQLKEGAFRGYLPKKSDLVLTALIKTTIRNPQAIEPEITARIIDAPKLRRQVEGNWFEMAEDGKWVQPSKPEEPA